jgi:hypothetical protein
MNLIKPMIIKMKNGAHTNNNFGTRRRRQRSSDVKSAKILISIYNPKMKVHSLSRSLLLTCFLNGTHLLCIHSLYMMMKIDKLILLTSPVPMLCCCCSSFVICLRLSLIEHFSFWQWKKPFKGRDKTEMERESITSFWAHSLMLNVVCIILHVGGWKSADFFLSFTHSLRNDSSKRLKTKKTCCLGIFISIYTLEIFKIIVAMRWEFTRKGRWKDAIIFISLSLLALTTSTSVLQ